MGTWEEESCELLESQNEIIKDVSSDETYRDGNGVDVNVKVEVIIANGDRTDSDECCDHENNVATEEVALVEQPERVELQTNDSDGSKIEDGKIEQHGEYDEEENNQVYPLRPAFEDCSFYVKTGTCKFGQNCRYNHPPSGGFQPVGDKEKGFEESIRSGGDAGKITCKYYQTAGGCKYGDSCRYNHSARRIQREYLELNFLGLPLRPLAQDCTFYLQNGSCGYGANCRFHHPNPTPNGESVRGGVTLPINYAGEPFQSFGGVSQTKSHSPNGINQRNGPCDGPEMSSFHQIIPPTPGWDRSQAISSHPTNKIPLPHQVMNFSKRVDPLTHHRNPVQIGEFPERPGQSDCDYFMKTGDCKYGTACRYNHPRSQMHNSSLPLLSSKHLYSSPAPKQHVESCQFVNLNSNNMRKDRMSFGQHQNQQIQNEEFPERAGEPECEYYMKTGQCKYKSACRYHHPRSRVPNSSQSRCALSEKGLPLRPGARLCRNYEQQGMCKYGKICLYDHPEDYSPDIPPVTTQFDSLTHVPPMAPTAANLGPPAADNVNSSWNDGWEM